MIRLEKAPVKKIVYEHTDIISSVVCDSCGREIIPSDGWEYDEKNSQFVSVHTWHNDWGNDSCDSHQYIELCHECAGKYVEKYVASEMPSSTCHIECNTVRLYRDSDGYIKTSE